MDMMRKRPVIGIIGDFSRKESRFLPGYRALCVGNAYVEAVLNAGGVPVVIPGRGNDIEKSADV